MSLTELEALVGHLFVVDGRSISTASPGAVAAPAPRRAARGREADTIFALISLAEDQRAPAAFYERLTSQLTGSYFNTQGSVTSALRGAAGSLNDLLLSLNADRSQPLEVGTACAVMRERELTLIAVGPVRCFLVHNGQVERLPPEDELDDATVLGISEQPHLRFYRFEVGAGDFLILADVSLDRLDGSTVQHAVGSSEIKAVLNNLRSVVGDYTTAQVIKFVQPAPEEEREKAPEAEPKPKPSSPQQRPGLVPRLGIADRSKAAPVTVTDSKPKPRQQPDKDSFKEKSQAVGKSLTTFFQRVGGGLTLGLANLTGGLKKLFEKTLPEEEIENPLEEKFQLSTTMQIGVVIGVALLVAVITTTIYQMRGQTSQYAQLVREAQGELELARTGTNQAEARPHWETAVFLLNEAFRIRTPSEEVLQMREEALSALDTYDHVTRVQPVLLREYDSESVLRGPIVHGANVYLLDETNDILYREDLDESMAVLTNQQPQIVTRQGNLANDQPVGGLIDMIWMDEGGLPQNNVLAVLDRNGLLITYSPSWGLGAIRLQGTEGWQDPRAMVVFGRDLYVLDAGANEIWVFLAGTESYPTPPQPYFTDVVPNLADAVDLAVDTNGNFYVLHSNGRISKYFQGRQEPFEFSGLPQPVTQPASLFLNLSLYDRAFFIADPGGGRLYTTAVNGTFLRNYRDSNELFEAITGAYNIDRPPHVYITAGNGLYYFSRP